MLLPIGHENMSARRWPVVTLGLIVINVVAFVITQSGLEDASATRTQAATVREHILILAAFRPDLTMTPEEQKVVDDFKEANPQRWQWNLDNAYNRPVEDGFDAHIRMISDQEVLQRDMNDLAKQLAEVGQTTTLLDEYAFVPAHPKPISYLTANFLHGGWIHLIGNMWFLWLAGFVLEDTWGRIIYGLFYLIAGAAALQIYAWATPGSIMPALGASGAVAALMGAFLVRFPTMQIKMVLWRLFRFYRFEAQAYWLLPLWLLGEIFYGTLSGNRGGVAHWAHVGGFVFGALVALLMRLTRLEHVANKAIEAKINKAALSNDKVIVDASDLMEHGQIDAALSMLESYIAANPNSSDAWRLKQQIHWRKGEIPAFHEASLKLISLHLRSREPELALQEYQDFVNSGGEKLPSATWLDLCRALEAQDPQRALAEYQKFIAANATERQSLMAQIACGRLCVKKLNRPNEGLKFYEAAAASKIPHLDLDMNITAGMREAKAAMSAPAASVAAN
jgi:membrane associated rhomboid family serine protease